MKVATWFVRDTGPGAIEIVRPLCEVPDDAGSVTVAGIRYDHLHFIRNGGTVVMRIFAQRDLNAADVLDVALLEIRSLRGEGFPPKGVS